MRHFVAYHSVARMGREYGDSGSLNFLTRKGWRFLEQVRHNRVWALTGRKAARGPTVYHCAGTYIVSDFERFTDAGWEYLIKGEDGFDFNPRPCLNDLPWFEALYREQNNFSLGLNEIRDPVVIEGLKELARIQGTPVV